jgi:hypothetical protein
MVVVSFSPCFINSYFSLLISPCLCFFSFFFSLSLLYPPFSLYLTPSFSLSLRLIYLHFYLHLCFWFPASVPCHFLSSFPCFFHPVGCLSGNTHSRSCALLEKPTIVQLFKNFPAFYWTRRFITVFTTVLHWSLSWATSIQSIQAHPISLRSILI